MTRAIVARTVVALAAIAAGAHVVSHALAALAVHPAAPAACPIVTPPPPCHEAMGDPANVLVTCGPGARIAYDGGLAKCECP